MSDHIKSKDLCFRCIYAFERYCSKISCDDCRMLIYGHGCMCEHIKENTPCPYFKEAKDDD